MDIQKRIEQLLIDGDTEEIRAFLKGLPPEIDLDEHLRQRIVVLHEKIARVDPIVSGHIHWERAKRNVVLDRWQIGDVLFTINVSSVLDATGVDYVVAGCESSLDSSTFTEGGLLRHIEFLEGSAFFPGIDLPMPLDPFGVREATSGVRNLRYLFINIKGSYGNPSSSALNITLQAYRRVLDHVARTPHAKRIVFPVLGWSNLTPEERSVAPKEIVKCIRNFCKAGNIGQLVEIRISLHALDAALMFAHGLSEAKQEKIESLKHDNELMQNALGENTNLLYNFNSEAFKNALREISPYIDKTINVTFVGETGVGKTYFAKYMHEHSARRHKPFVSISCNEFPENLLTSQLFGWERGAYTGAVKPGPGRIRQANNGTLFIDEIDKSPINVQKALLNFIDNRNVTPVGGNGQTHVDVRLVVASIIPLDKMVTQGTMLKDFYHRLVPPQITLPPLRERREDILPMARMWLGIYARQYNRASLTAFSEDVERLLVTHPWPGNVRELQRTVETCVLRTPGEVVTAESLRFAPAIGSSNGVELSTVSELEQFNYKTTRAFYERRLLEAGNNVSEVARRLNIPVKTLHSRLKELGLP